MKCRGYTLAELMIVCAITVILMSVLGGMADSMYRTNRHSKKYTKELLDLRRTVRQLETDLRSGADVPYTLEGRTLHRDGKIVARNIGTFEIERDGRLTTVRIGPGHRVMTLKVARR